MLVLCIVIDNGCLEKTLEICDKLKDYGVEARSFWKPIHKQAPYLNALIANDLSVSESIWEKIITLPCSSGITDNELNIVVDAVDNVIKSVS